jgi:hypothetical protein
VGPGFESQPDHVRNETLIGVPGECFDFWVNKLTQNKINSDKLPIQVSQVANLPILVHKS